MSPNQRKKNGKLASSTNASHISQEFDVRSRCCDRNRRRKSGRTRTGCKVEKPQLVSAAVVTALFVSRSASLTSLPRSTREGGRLWSALVQPEQWRQHFSPNKDSLSRSASPCVSNWSSTSQLGVRETRRSFEGRVFAKACEEHLFEKKGRRCIKGDRCRTSARRQQKRSF